MKRFFKAVATLVVVLVLISTALSLLFRSGSDRFLTAIRGFNKHFLNPVMLRFAGTRGFYAAALHHAGRVSGRPYVTPVLADPTPDVFIVPLLYGTGVDWLKNVQASGS